MAKTRGFELAELVRGITFDVGNDKIVTTRSITTRDMTSGGSTTTATTEVALDTFAKASYRTARYIVSMFSGSDFHSTEIVVVHDGSAVTLTQYGTMKSTNLADIDADIVGANVRLLVTPASGTSTVIKFDRTTVDA
jgi:hypothetical protein